MEQFWRLDALVPEPLSLDLKLACYSPKVEPKVLVVLDNFRHYLKIAFGRSSARAAEAGLC